MGYHNLVGLLRNNLRKERSTLVMSSEELQDQCFAFFSTKASRNLKPEHYRRVRPLDGNCTYFSKAQSVMSSCKLKV